MDLYRQIHVHIYFDQKHIYTIRSFIKKTGKFSFKNITNAGKKNKIVQRATIAHLRADK